MEADDMGNIVDSAAKQKKKESAKEH